MKQMTIGGLTESYSEFCIEAPLLEHRTVVTDSFVVSCDFSNLRTIAASNIRAFDRLKQTTTVVTVRVPESRRCAI